METRQATSPSSSRRRNAPPPPPPVLHEDLIMEILSWLPVKSLVKFSCVCKSWNFLFSDPNFVKLHLHRSARNPNLLLPWENDDYVGVVHSTVRCLLGNPSPTFNDDDCYPLADIDGSFKVIGSCNGLVCLLCDGHRNWHPELHCFYLCNPATKLTSDDFVCTLDNDDDNDYRFAFGYDNLSDTYKVVAFIFNDKAKEESQKHQAKICSAGNNCWRDIHSFPVIPFYDVDVDYPGFSNGVYFNGTLNWLAVCVDDYECHDTIRIVQFVILSLDLGMETCTQLLLPRLHECLRVDPTIGVLMDCLCFSHDSKETHFVVWQMKEFGVEKSWTQFMKVSYQDLQIDRYDFQYPLLPLCVSENGGVLIMAVVAELQAILYHQRDNRVEQIVISDNIHWNKTMDYVESLVSPCCNHI